MNPIEFTPAMIWDIALAVVILISIGFGLCRGLAAALANLAGTIACIAAAAVFSGTVATWAYDMFLAKRIETAAAQDVMEKLSGFTGLLQQAGLIETVNSTAAGMVRMLTVALLKVLAFVLIYLAAKLIVRFIIHLTKKVNDVPVLGKVNRLLGGLLGAIEGLLVCYIIGLGVTLLISFSQNEWSWINSSIVENTRLLDWFIHIKLPFKL